MDGRVFILALDDRPIVGHNVRTLLLRHGGIFAVRISPAARRLSYDATAASSSVFGATFTWGRVGHRQSFGACRPVQIGPDDVPRQPAPVVGIGAQIHLDACVDECVVGDLAEPQRSRAFCECVTFGRCGSARRECVAEDRARLDRAVDHPVERDVSQWPVRVRPADHIAMCATEPDFLDVSSLRPTRHSPNGPRPPSMATA